MILAVCLAGAMFVLQPVSSMGARLPYLICLLAAALLSLSIPGELHNRAFIMILAFGLLFAFLTPILDVPDEPAHFARALFTADGNLFLYDGPEGLPVSGVYPAVSQYFSKPFFQLDLSEFQVPAEAALTLDVGTTRVYPFFSYLPQTVGIWLGRLFGTNAFAIFFLGRITNLLSYALIVRKALKLTPVYRVPIFAVCVFPMCLFLAASHNADAAVLAIGLLVVCFFLKLRYGDSPVTTADILRFALLCTVMGMIKSPYALLIGLLVFLPLDRLQKRKAYFLCWGMVFVCGFLSLGWLIYTMSIPNYAHLEYMEQAGVDAAQQLSYILHHLPRFFLDFLRCTVQDIPEHWNMLFQFGWLTYGSLLLPLLYAFFSGALWLFYPRERTVPRNRITRIGAALVAAGIIVGIGLAMYVTWTRVGASEIDGVQGRYFLILLALFPVIFAIGPNRERLPEKQLVLYQNLAEAGTALFLILSLRLSLAQYY